MATIQETLFALYQVSQRVDQVKAQIVQQQNNLAQLQVQQDKAKQDYLQVAGPGNGQVLYYGYLFEVKAGVVSVIGPSPTIITISTK